VADKRLVISIFDTEAAAEEAAAGVRHSGAVLDDAIDVLVLDDKGHLKSHKVGATSGGKGAAAGAVVGLIGGPLGLGLAVFGGAMLGKLHHKDIGLDDADRDRITAALNDGKAAVGVLADPDELVAVESLLAGRGGDTTRHELDQAALQEEAEGAA
jgi:uncharacterized membrane protein